ncbi:MAG: hypothetical protein GH148_09780 [Clostridia bacterium]|nr:hypothetical protein [Clostridia bacterium]
MQRYKCSKCQKVFCGWAVKYKHKNKCPDCGGELRQISNNKKYRKYRKGEGVSKGDPGISRYRA